MGNEPNDVFGMGVGVTGTFQRGKEGTSAQGTSTYICCITSAPNAEGLPGKLKDAVILS